VSSPSFKRGRCTGFERTEEAVEDALSLRRWAGWRIDD